MTLLMRSWSVEGVTIQAFISALLMARMAKIGPVFRYQEHPLGQGGNGFGRFENVITGHFGQLIA